MKTISTICILCLFSITIFAQETDEVKPFRHEIGIDVSSILGGVLVESAFGFTTVEPYKFPLNYRLYTPILNFRTAIGISSASEVYSTIYVDGLDTLEGNDIILNARIGIEKMHQIGSRWSFYYGIDYEYSHLNDFRQTKSISRGYQTDWTVSGQRHGIAPMLGFRLEFNDRIGLQTELKCVYSINRQDVKREYTAIVDNPINMPENESTHSIINNINFEIPNVLILTVKL